MWYYIYLLTPWCRVLLEQLTGLQLVKKFPAFYGTRKFITALTSIRHLSLSWANPIQSTYPHPTSWRSILILSTYLRLGPPSGLFPSGFPTKILYTPLSSPIRATCPTHLILLDFIDFLCVTIVFKIGVPVLHCNLDYPEKLDNGYSKQPPKHVAAFLNICLINILLLSNNIYLLNCKYNFVVSLRLYAIMQ